MKYVKQAAKFAAVAVLATALSSSFAGLEGAVKVSNWDREDLGSGHVVNTEATLNTDGLVTGNSTLKNYNNVEGFKAKIHLKVLAANGDVIYVAKVSQNGVDASLWNRRRCVVDVWKHQVPAEVMRFASSAQIIHSRRADFGETVDQAKANLKKLLQLKDIAGL